MINEPKIVEITEIIDETSTTIVTNKSMVYANLSLDMVSSCIFFHILQNAKPLKLFRF